MRDKQLFHTTQGKDELKKTGRAGSEGGKRMWSCTRLLIEIAVHNSIGEPIVAQVRTRDRAVNAFAIGYSWIYGK